VPYHTGKALLGSYLALRGKSLTQSLALRRQQLGRGQRIVHKFYPWSANVPAAEPEVPSGSVLMVSMNGARYGQINNGASDKLIALAATRFAAMKRPVMLRWGWEMNGNWFAWDGTHNSRKPSGYITAWQRMHRIFAAHGASNVAWVWGPNWNSGPNVAWNHMDHYYPGDAYVDWVGVSGYDFGGESPSTLFSGICDAYGSRKPIVLAETAAVGGTSAKTKWINKLHAFVDATPSVGAVVWFDTDIQRGSPYNFRPDTASTVLAAYRSMARSARFSG
jgi:hypothetical protein